MTQSPPIATETDQRNRGTDENEQGKDIYSCSELKLLMEIMTLC